LTDTIKLLENGKIQAKEQPEGRQPHRPMTFVELIEIDKMLQNKTN